MAGERLYAHRGAPTHNAVAVNGVTHAAISYRPVRKFARNPVAGGVEDSAIVDQAHSVSLFGNDVAALDALIGDDAANLVIDTFGTNGALEKCTLKNVKFDQVLSDKDIPESDSGGKVAAYGISGDLHYGDSDTPALMEIWAVDV